jgi:hypothetical protein
MKFLMKMIEKEVVIGQMEMEITLLQEGIRK